MNELEFTDEIIGYLPCESLIHIRDQGDLLDLRIVTQEGIVLRAHRLVLLTRFPVLLNKLRGEGSITLELKRFSRDIVEAIINYAYSGRLLITSENVLRLFLMGHNLGSQRIISWCIEYLKTRLSLDNILGVWSVANSTENEELIGLCLPTVTTNFTELYQRRDFLAKTTSGSLKLLLNRILQTEDLKLQATSKWLNSGFQEGDLSDRVRDFKTVISSINLTHVTRATLIQIWQSNTAIGSIQQCRSYIVPTWIRAQFAVHGPDFGGLLEAQNQRTRNRIFIYGWEKSTKSWMISSIPQLQPEMSISIRVPFSGESVICGDKIFVFGGYNTKDSLMTIDLSSGETFELPVFLQPRNDYSIAVKDEFIFIFGGYYDGKCLQVCEKFDILNNTISKLTDMLYLRYGSSALNIPGIGIIVVGGCDRIGSIFPTLRSIEMLIEDESEENGVKWIEFSPMLKERHRPGVALFQGSIIVAGGDTNFTIEYYPLTAEDQEVSQWTFISGIDEHNLKRISLVTFDNRLLLSSNDSEGNIYEFSQNQENRSLRSYKWEKIFKIDNFLAHKLITSEQI
ncbi:unnamed protein product, partial [Hymenolepis diminuta]